MPQPSPSSQGKGPPQRPSRGRLAEETLRKQARLIDLAPAGTIVREVDGTILFWSQGAEALYGWTKEEALGRRTHDLLRTEFPIPVEDILATLVSGGKWTGELHHVTKEGRAIIVQSSWLAELDATGEVVELLESNIDITERKRLQDHLEEVVQERTAQLREANAGLEAFSYTLSHEMKAPLRAILSFAQFAREDCGAQLSPIAKEYLENVSKAARRLDQLIQDILALSRISREQVEMRAVEVEPVLKELIAQRPEMQEPRAEVRLDGHLPAVQGQEALLTQIFGNLLGNAVKFVAAEVKPEVRVRAEMLGQTVRFWVEDNGIGIDRVVQEKVFELFGRGQRTKDYEGTGIGLAIVRKAAQRLGGRVGVESERGAGSRFWVELRAAGE